MGGKSRKRGQVSKRLIDRLVSQGSRPKPVYTSTKGGQKDGNRGGFDLFGASGSTKNSS